MGTKNSYNKQECVSDYPFYGWITELTKLLLLVIVCVFVWICWRDAAKKTYIYHSFIYTQIKKTELIYVEVR